MPSNFWPMSSNEADSNFKIIWEHFQQLEEQIRAVSNELPVIEKMVERLREQSTEQNTERSEEAGKQYNLLSELNKKADSICAAIFAKEYPIDVRFEREYYKNFPTGQSEEFPDFQQKFLNLVCGLDTKSIEDVVLSIQRLKIIQNTQDPVIALYSQEEKKIMREIIEHMFSSILPLSHNVFYYCGYLLPINHFEPCVFWDRYGIQHLTKPGHFSDADIIDAGAFIGDSALIFSPLTHRNVYAFEPVPQNYRYMQDTIKLNGLTNVVPVQAALGEQNGTISISVNDSSSTQFENDACKYAEKVEAKVVPMDEFVREHNLRVGLIKADVEGAEQSLLKGAMQTIKEQKPTLLISIYHNADDFFHIKPMLEQLNLGYRFKIRHPVCGSVMTETLLIAEAEQ